MVAEGRPANDVIDELYRMAVCRKPTDAEQKSAIDYVAAKQNAADGLEDVCWVLLNTDEFLMQH
jgi:hypothetical protein